MKRKMRRLWIKSKTHKLSEHHRLPTSLGGTSEIDNISYLTPTKHQSWHTLFQNWDAERIVEEINRLYIDPHYEVIAIKRGENQ